MRTRSSGVLAVSVVLAASMAGCESPSRGGAPGSIFDGAGSRPAIDPVRVRGPSLLYVKGAALHGVDLETGERRDLGRLATPEVFAAPTGRFIAEVVPREGDPEEERDFVLVPELRLLELDTGLEVVVGRGFAPLWHPTDDVVAYLRPRSPRRCSGEACSTRSEVVSLDVGSGRKDVLLPPGRWALLSWLGDGVLVSDAGRTGRVLWVGTDDAPQRLPFTPSEIWGGSPDGRWLIAARGRATKVHAVDDGSIEERGVRVDLGGAVLAEGAWAPDSSFVAAAMLDPSARGARASRLVVVRLDDRDPRAVRGLYGVVGPVLLSRDAGTVVTSRASGPGGLSLEAVACDVDNRSGCRPLFSWTRGVTLLALVR